MQKSIGSKKWNSSPGRLSMARKCISKEYQLYLLALPAIVYLFIFHYIPIYGVQIAFKNFTPGKGIWGSDWVGFDQFIKFFSSYQFERLLSNTLLLSVLQLIICFPFPIILALMLNQVGNKRYKKLVQTVTYAPHFISIVVLVGMMSLFLAPNNGIINTVIKNLGGEAIHFTGDAKYFRGLYIISNAWQHMGWGSIIFLAALSAVNPELYEAARIDGCTRLKLIWHVDIPSILPTIIIVLIMDVGSLMDLGFQKAFLMQNSLNLATSETIATYVYKIGLINAQYSYSAAVGLFNSVVNIILLISVNWVSKKLTENSLW